jgi:hypothetical protein
MRSVRFALFGLALLGLASTASASPIHYLIDAAGADPTAPITAAGHTPVALTDLTAADLLGVSVLWITNGSNGGPPSDVSNNVGALADWVFGGGVLSYHDRYVADGSLGMADLLPGAAGVTFDRDFNNDADIDLLLPAHPVVAGLNNASLDGGNSSSHGFAALSSLPAGAVAVLNRGGAPDEIVDFYYPYGDGWVYYSTIPLDFFLGGAGNNPPRADIVNIYAVNEAEFQAELAGLSVPEPGVLALLGVAAISALRRRRR